MRFINRYPEMVMLLIPVGLFGASLFLQSVLMPIRWRWYSVGPGCCYWGPGPLYVPFLAAMSGVEGVGLGGIHYVLKVASSSRVKARSAYAFCAALSVIYATTLIKMWNWKGYPFSVKDEESRWVLAVFITELGIPVLWASMLLFYSVFKLVFASPSDATTDLI